MDLRLLEPLRRLRAGSYLQSPKRGEEDRLRPRLSTGSIVVNTAEGLEVAFSMAKL
jgi:hypothetical protein